MRNILLVEDEDLLRETYSTILSTQPYNHELAENGAVALEMCKSKTYDLILLDIMMPIMNGIEFLKEFRKLPDSNTPVIILSNLSSGKELDEAAQLNVVKCLLKASLSPKELLANIRYEIEAPRDI